MSGRTTWIWPALIALAISACGGASIPRRQMTEAKAAIRGAVEAGAEQIPKGALHLKMARDQVEYAERLINAMQKLTKAKHLLRRAEADANLAIALAKQADAERERNEAVRKLHDLRGDE